MSVQVLMLIGVVLSGVYVLDNLKHNRHPVDPSSEESGISMVNRLCGDEMAQGAGNTRAVVRLGQTDRAH